MERLTEKHYLAEDHYMKCSEDCSVDMDCVDCPAFDKLVERLAAYEDTGLTPEAVETVKLALAAKHLVDLETLNNTPISRLVELAEADKAGRAVVLPCKVGDTVYFVNAKHILEFTVVGYAVDETGISWVYSEHVDKTGHTYERTFSPDRIGKTTFLSREGAEKALHEACPASRRAMCTATRSSPPSKTSTRRTATI